jgi:hypothetical protein
MNLQGEIGAIHRIEEVEADGKEIPEATVVFVPQNTAPLESA